RGESFFPRLALQVHRRGPDRTTLAQSGSEKRELKRAGQLYVRIHMYAYSFYLFFDFAGYSAFAIASVICLAFTLRKTSTGRSWRETFVISGIVGISPFRSGFATTFTCVFCSQPRAANGSKACTPPRSSDTFWPSD